ncbi:DUF2971 domain-containing protein [Methylophilus sp. OH31]|uniref:DUF2971 domain-containing protein n=1 Tax=Methylophilus sp. OH31 TaxID=1387312 RepID=UPI000466B067|nr:DUF2971 domain-containing protein [Methylophilus sp. OH31]
MKAPKTFYKYRAFDTNTISSLCYDKLYFSNPGDFNDPLDCSPTIHRDRDSSIVDLERLFAFFTQKRIATEALEHIKSSKIKVSDSKGLAYRIGLRQTDKELARIAYMATDLNSFGENVDENLAHLLINAIQEELSSFYERGVCCFSTTFSSPLLWSHYGQQHKGLCIGYTTERLPAPKPEKVVYGGKRSISTSTLCKAFLEGDKATQTIVDRDVLLRKATGWKYEAEWRLIDKQGLQDSPMLMTEITFGLRCEPSIIHSVIKALEGRNNVKYYEMYTVAHSFALRRKLVDIDELQHYLPVTAMSGYEMFGDI